MDRSHQLEELVASLSELVAMLRLDAKCQWTLHFERSLEWAGKLVKDGASQQDLNDLAVSIMHVYGGMGSFTDYAPATYDQASGAVTTIPGMESLERPSGRVYERALALRVIGDAL